MTTCSIPDCDIESYCRGWCRNHYARWQRQGDPLIVLSPGTAEVRFWAKVEKTETCWLWIASTNAYGYGQFFPTRKKSVPSHRWAYEALVGPIPPGLVIDHLCRVHNCVNPEHLEPVTQLENHRRGLCGVLRTHCAEGHELTPENTSVRPSDNARRCRICMREKPKERLRRRREESARLAS